MGAHVAFLESSWPGADCQFISGCTFTRCIKCTAVVAWKCLSWTAFNSCTQTSLATGHRGQTPHGTRFVASAPTKAGLSRTVFGTAFPETTRRTISQPPIVPKRLYCCLTSRGIYLASCLFFFFFSELYKHISPSHCALKERALQSQLIRPHSLKNHQSGWRYSQMCHTARSVDLITEFTKHHSCKGAFKTCSLTFF